MAKTTHWTSGGNWSNGVPVVGDTIIIDDSSFFDLMIQDTASHTVGGNIPRDEVMADNVNGTLPLGDVFSGAGTLSLPDRSDVRAGVSYGQDSDTTGTLDPLSEVGAGNVLTVAGGTYNPLNYLTLDFYSVLDSSFAGYEDDANGYVQAGFGGIPSSEVMDVAGGSLSSDSVIADAGGNYNQPENDYYSIDGPAYGPSASITGTFDPMASAVFPDPAAVSDMSPSFGPTGGEYTASLPSGSILDSTGWGSLDSNYVWNSVGGNYTASFPDPASVSENASLYGDSFNTYTPSFPSSGMLTGTGWGGTFDVSNLSNDVIQAGITWGVDNGDTGTLLSLADAVFPTENQVLSTITYGPTGAEYTGNVTLPSVNKVTSVAYGPNNTLFGIFSSPALSKVMNDTHYGDPSSFFYGTLTTLATNKVKAGEHYGENLSLTGTYDPVTGNYTNPGIAHVQSGTTYKFAGSNLTGTYVLVTPVIDGEISVIKGDDVTITRTYVSPSLSGATVVLNSNAIADSRVRFSVNGSVSGQTVSFTISDTITSLMFTGPAYEWNIVATIGDVTTTLESGTFHVVTE